MPLINYITKMIRSSIGKYIIDIPDIPDEKKLEIIDKGTEFIGKMVESASKGAAEGFADKLEDKMENM